MQLAEKVHAITKRFQIPLIIDDRVDVAAGKEGNHLDLYQQAIERVCGAVSLHAEVLTVPVEDAALSIVEVVP